MRVQSGWRPRLQAGPGTASQRLTAALAEDILDGVVAEGERLPTHRMLAEHLGIALGTVTKAYAELSVRGLVRGSRGRGMFVSYRAERSSDVIDLALNMPPQLLADSVIADALASSAGRVGAEVLSSFGPHGGHLEHKRTAAAWLGVTGLDLEPEGLVLTHGAQQGIAAALMAASSPGHPARIFTEEVTFPGALTYARMTGHPVHGIAVDHQGMRTDVLDRALSQRRAPNGSPSVVYVTPTLHNPTGATMTGARRRELVRVARRHDALIIEDDVYALSDDRPAPALVSLAPERTFYVSSASKALSPAVRLGMVSPPAAHRQSTVDSVRALGIPVSPLICVLLDELLTAGVASAVRAAIRDEGVRRTELARETFGRALFGTSRTGHHVFLPLPLERARQLVRDAGAAGVRLTEPEAMMADPAQGASGVRLCLGHPGVADLSRGLELVRSLLGPATKRVSG